MKTTPFPFIPLVCNVFALFSVLSGVGLYLAPIPVLPENSRRMMRFATILGALLMSFSAVAQVGQGTLKGRVTDFDSKDALPFASVVLFLNGNQVAGTTPT